MTDSTQFEIGASATCTDGPCGQVRSVVIDPVAQKVTDLVIEAKHREGLGRLVPIDLISGSGSELTLHCDSAAFEKLNLAEEIQFMPGSMGYATYGPGQALIWPYYGLGSGSSAGVGNITQAVTYDTLPLGEVAVHRGDQVHATDGEIGLVQGLVIDRSTHHVTHVLLQEGHLWGRKEVAIPIGKINGFGSGIRLSIDKSEVQELPAVEIEQAS